MGERREANAKADPSIHLFAIENGTVRGNLDSMTATVMIDKAGRLVLPKPIRERMHLRAGSQLKAEIVGDKIELSQETPAAKIVRKKDGLPVVVGWKGFD